MSGTGSIHFLPLSVLFSQVEVARIPIMKLESQLKIVLKTWTQKGVNKWSKS